MDANISQNALDRLFSAALEAAVARIEKDGHFHPLLFEQRADGTIQNVAVLETGSIDGAQSVIDRLVDLLRNRGKDGTIRAAAIVIDRHEDNAVEVRLRARNYSADIRAPYGIETRGLIRRRRELTLGEFSVQTVANDVF